jgi:hypothetical protein
MRSSVRSRPVPPREAMMAAKFTISMRQEVAPKVSGGLVAIEEELREEHKIDLSVAPIAKDLAYIDNFPVEITIDNKWLFGNRLVAEVHGKIQKDLEADCTISVNGAQVFAGSIEEWWNTMCELLRAEIHWACN